MAKDIKGQELYPGDKIVCSDPQGYLSVRTIKKITNKSVIMENSWWISLDKADDRIFKLRK